MIPVRTFFLTLLFYGDIKMFVLSGDLQREIYKKIKQCEAVMTDLIRSIV